jgi:hypothetical protein
MTDQEIINDIFEDSRYFYPQTFKFLKSLPNTKHTDTGITFYYSDVIDYAMKNSLSIPDRRVGQPDNR